MLRIILILSLYFISTESGLYAQTQVEIKLQIDSLIKESDALLKLRAPYSQNIELIKRAQKLASSIDFWEKDVECLFRISLFYDLDSNKKLSQEYLDKAYYKGKKHIGEDYSVLPFIYAKKVRSLRSNKEYLASNALAREGLEVLPKLKYYNKGNLLNFIVYNFISLGDYSSALPIIDLAIDQWNEKKTSDRDLFIYCESHYLKARVLAQVNKDNLVYSNLKRAEEIMIHSSYPKASFELINIWTYGGSHFAKQGNIEKCEYFLNKIDSSGYDMTDNQKGEYYSILADYRSNLDFPIDSIVSLTELSNSFFNKDNLTQNNDINKYENLRLLGDLYLEAGDYNMSIRQYNGALDSLRVDLLNVDPSSIVDKADVIPVMSSLFESHYLDNDQEGGRNVLDKLLPIMRYFIIENNSDSHIEFWAEENISVLEKGLKFAYQYEDYDLAFRLIEENKSNLLVKDMITHQLRSSAGYENSYVQQERELIYEISRLRSLIISVTSEEEKEELNKEIVHNELELEKVKVNLESVDQDYVDVKYNLNRPDLVTYQSSLTNNECVVEFFIGLDNIYQIFITPDKVMLLKEDNPVDIRNDVQVLFESNSTNADVITVDSISSQVFNKLGLEKLKEFAPNCKRLKIIPDDYLSNVSFGQLNDNEGQALVDDYSIEYQYSSNLDRILDERQNEKTTKSFIGYAYESKNAAIAMDIRSCSTTALTNLLCSKKELSAIQSIVSDDKIGVIENKLDFVNYCSNAKVIHLATHACVDAEDPENSRLYFGGEFLTSYELKLLNLNSELVVLSACETGYGDIVSGEGSMSISKAFFQAGTKSTLVSLWPVDDCSTSQLMELFYTELKTGLPKDEALRQAQLKYRQTANPAFTAPYYWAGFVVVGDTSPVWSSSIFDLKWILGIGLAIVLIVIAFLVKSRKSSTL